MRKHQKITLAVLAALACVPFFVQSDPAGAQRPAAAQLAIEAPRVEAPLALFATLPSREAPPQLRSDPFSRERQSVQPSARQAALAAPPAAVAAPPNPYRYAGELRQPGVTRRFLVRGNDILEVNPGDVLSDGYRVEAVTENEVVLLHIGTGIRQTLAQKTT